MLLSIDPSIANLGWAILTHDNVDLAPLDTDAHPQLVTFGTVKCSTSHLNFEARIDTIIGGLEEAIAAAGYRLSIKQVVIEKPQLWGAYKSTASLHAGDLLGLHLLTGALYWWANSHYAEAFLIPVTEWKGQLPKKVTQKRMEKKYGVKFQTDDESDAVGLGDYWLTEGQLKTERDKK